MIVEELIELLSDLPKDAKIAMDGIQLRRYGYKHEEWDMDEYDFKFEPIVKRGPLLIIRGWRSTPEWPGG